MSTSDTLAQHVARSREALLFLQLCEPAGLLDEGFYWESGGELCTGDAVARVKSERNFQGHSFLLSPLEGSLESAPNPRS